MWSREKNNAGFTLIEVMVALAIMVITFTAMMNGNLFTQMMSLRSRKAIVASFLAAQKMSEVKLEIEGLPLSEIPEKEEGAFPKPFDDYKWAITSQPFEYDIGAAAAGLLQGGEEETQSEQLASVLRNISGILKESIREVTVTVLWTTRKIDRKFALTTHVIDRNLKLPPLGGVLGFPGGGEGGGGEGDGGGQGGGGGMGGGGT